MTTKAFKERIENFQMRLRLLQEDFERFTEDFGCYEDEQKCAYCGEAKDEADERCPACDSPFCQSCWKDYVQKKFQAKGEKP